MAERLGKTKKELLETMDAQELMDWIAYDKSLDEQFKADTLREIALEKQKNDSAEIEAQKIINMFMALGMKPPPDKYGK